LTTNPQWDYAIVEQDSLGYCILISYTSLTECRDEPVCRDEPDSQESLMTVIAGLGEQGWELVATSDAFSSTERRVRTFAFKRLHDEDRAIVE
jgi:hypothetical protein